MNQVLFILRWVIVLIYVFSFGSYYAYFRHKGERTALLNRRYLLIAIGFHSAYLITLTTRLGHLPIGDLYQVLTTTAWLSVLVYLMLEIRLKEMVMGVFFVPVIVILHTISSLFIDVDKPLADVLSSILFEFHVVVIISGYAAFAIAFISSVMYILLSREMQSRRLGIFFKRLPSLEFFDTLSNQAVNSGLVLVAAGIALGLYLGINVWEGQWALDAKLWAVVLSWSIYLVHFISRRSMGWQGRRAAIVSVIGFNWLLFSFIIVNLFFSKFHNFQ